MSGKSSSSSSGKRRSGTAALQYRISISSSSSIGKMKAILLFVSLIQLVSSVQLAAGELHI